MSEQASAGCCVCVRACVPLSMARKAAGSLPGSGFVATSHQGSCTKSRNGRSAACKSPPLAAARVSTSATTSATSRKISFVRTVPARHTPYTIHHRRP